MTISRVGTATGTNTATVPAHAIGDLIIIAAFRNTTGTPSLPAGYTSILTKTGTTSSMRVGFKIATATNDTAGTWTNATSTVCHVYRSSLYSTGGSLYIGGSASNSATVNTINYPALAMTHADNTSWALGFAGVGNLTETVATAPTGMTNQSIQTSAATQSSGHDTNGTVSSWSSTNVVTTGTAGNSVTATVELIENQPGSAISNFVQHYSTAYLNSIAVGELGDNYVITADPSLAGNSFVLVVAYPSGVTPSVSDDKSNSWPVAASGVTADNGAGTTALTSFVLPSATTGTSTFTVSFGGNPQAFVKIWLTQLYNVTATVSTSAHVAGSNTGGIVSPGSITPGTNNCLVLSYMCATSKGLSTNPALIVPESGYQLNDADISWGTNGMPNASQFALQTTATATTPRFYLNAGGTETYNVITLALTTGSQGTPKPSGAGVAPWIDRQCYFSTNAAPAALLVQIPSTGNCQLFRTFLSDTGSPSLTSVVDNDAVTWTKQQPTGSGTAQILTRINSSGRSSRTATLNIAGGPGNAQIIFTDVSNCDPSPIAASAGVGSTGASNVSTIASQPSIAATASNQLMIGWMGIGIGPSFNVTTPSGAVYDLQTTQVAQYTASIAVGVLGAAPATMTVTAVAWGTVESGQSGIISDAGAVVAAGTSNEETGTGAGLTGTYGVQPSQTVSSRTMFQSGSDVSTLNWGNAAFHWFNGSNTSTQNVAYGIANQAGNSVLSVAIVLKGAAGTAFLAKNKIILQAVNRGSYI